MLKARKKVSKKNIIPWNRVVRVAKEQFGIKKFKSGQKEVIESVLAGKDCLAIMPTGGGKSLCFQLPAMMLTGPALVVSPLLSLMQDQKEKLAEVGVDAAKLDSSLTSKQKGETLQKIEQGDYEIIYVTPERLDIPEERILLSKKPISLLVIDEAHCVSQWGHGFRPSYLGIKEAIHALGNPRVLALTATATPEDILDIQKQLGIEDSVLINMGIERSNLDLKVVPTVNEEKKLAELDQIIQRNTGTGIVYAATVKEAEKIAADLVGLGHSVGLYHGKLKKSQREENQRAFMEDQYKVMVATKAFGMGIDHPHIRFIVHYQFPDSLESYYQEIGRAGRDGKKSECVVLYQLEDKRVQSYFLGGKYPKGAEAESYLKALKELGQGASPKEVAELSGIGIKKARVILAWLLNEGLLERKRWKLRIMKDLNSESIQELVSEYEGRQNQDRERLETFMRFAESTQCRFQFLKDYFEDEASEECGHCDNCLRAPEFKVPAGAIEERAPVPA